MTLQSSSQQGTVIDSEINVELYECGCKVRYYKVDSSEWEGDPPEKPITVGELVACPRHYNNGHSTAPTDSRLVSVFGQHETYLSE